MKVVIATGIFPPDVGGPATFVPKLVAHWREKGWAVEVITYSDGTEGDATLDYPVHRISRKLPVALRYWSYFHRLWKSARGANLIFAQDPVAAGFPAWLVATLKRKRFLIKIVGDFAWEHARIQGGYGGSLEDFQAERQLARPFKLMRRVERLVARHADGVIVPSQYLAGVARSWGAKPAKVEVIYNGVEPIILKDQPTKLPHRIVTVGRLVPWKGIDTLIGALPKVIERVPEVTLVIVGDGPDEARLKERVRLLKLENRVEFTGRLSREQVARTLASGGVFALLSSYEGFSHQLVEAFQSGTAVVATNVGGNPELVQDGVNGLLVGYGEATATAEALVRLLQDRKLAEQIAGSALERVREFSVETQMTRMTEACVGARDARVLIVSRDGTLADPNSRGAWRMRLYAERVGHLHVVALARAKSQKAELAPNLTVEVVDVRHPWLAFHRAVWAVIHGQKKYGIGLISAQDPHEAGLVAWKASRFTKTPLLIEEHGGIYLGPHWRQESKKNRIFYGIGLWLLGRADALRAVSQKIAADLARRFPNTPLVQLPVFTETLAVVSQAPGNVYGYVGRFVAQKNLPLLLKALSQVHHDDPSARLIMAGGGPLESSLRQLSVELALGEAVTWIPFSEDVASVYAQIGTLTLSSDYEGWARVVIEAMSCGIPVVMTDVGCANEAMRDGTEGRVVPIGDQAALVQAMKDAAEPFRHQLWSVAAKLRAAGLETPPQLADRLTDFWKKCLGL